MKSIYEICCDSDDNFTTLFSGIGDKGSWLLNAAGDTTYRYPSKQQAMGAYRWANKVSLESLVQNDMSAQEVANAGSAIRIHLYDIGSDIQLLGAAIWVKKAVIGSLLRDIVTLSNGNNPVLFLTAIRSVFENIGQVLRLHQDLTSSVHIDVTSTEAKREAVILCAEVVQRICKGTRIDWETFLYKSFTTGKKKSYKPKSDEVDAAAESILKGIDALDKKVKGIRKSYEFLSEFAHPNIGQHNLLVRSANYAILDDGIRIWTRTYAVGDYGKGISEFSPQLRETLDLLLNCVALYERLDQELGTFKKKLFVFAKTVVKRGIKNHPHLFALDLRRPCPCFSGKDLGKCCGTKAARKRR